MAFPRDIADAAFRPRQGASGVFVASAVLLSSLLFSGCHIERIILEEPVCDQFVEVDTEDHVQVRLDETEATGFRWTASCSDPLVNITIEHEPGESINLSGLAYVSIRVRRGFVGPATVYLRCERRWSGECSRAIKLALHRRQTNVAGWR